MASTSCSPAPGGHACPASQPAVILTRERAALEDALQASRDGRGGALVVRGAAGLGTTTLLEHAIVSAAGFEVASVGGVESEQHLSYAGLHRLCVTMLDGVDQLPDPQRDALAAAFGVQSGAIDPFLVGLAVLRLLTEVSAQEPVLCVVDDAQWLDAASMQVLAFVARRITSEPVALMFGTKDPIEDLEGLPELVLRGLPNAEAHALLASVLRGPLCAPVRERIVNESQGNLRALVALTQSSTPAQLAGGFGLPAAMPTTDPLATTLRSRLEALAPPTRSLLLIAAAEPEGDPARFWRAAARLGIDPDAADDAVGLGLLEFGTRLTFLQPEMRSVVYHDAPFGERRRVHQALAEATEPDDDPEVRAWHRGHATLAADEDVADALERAAENAQVRGGFAAAAAFLERSALLTPQPDRRARRALLAARAKYEAGSLEAASELLTLADDGSLEELERARLERLRAELSFALRRDSEAPPMLLDAAKALEQLDVQLARDTYLQTLEATLLAGRLGAPHGLVEAATSGRAAPLATVPCASDLLLDGLARLFTDGYCAAVPTMQQAVQAFRSQDDPRWLGLACRVAAEVWDADALVDLASRWIHLNRECGALTQLPAALDYVAGLHVQAGNFASAARLIEDADAISAATGFDRVRQSPLVLAAWQGDELHTVELIEAGRRDARARGDGRLLTHTECVTALLYNGLGRYHDAFDALEQAYEREELFSCWILPEFIEAAARSDQGALALSAAEHLVQRTESSGTELALGFQARSLALVTDGPPAEKLYRQAIERLGRTPAAAHLARAHLLYGEWLRRERRRVDAREQLRVAHDLFSTMGATAFAARAHRELLATGERARKRTVETACDLTPQEAEIARLAGEGNSNPQIAATLFISARTVEYHLHKVFTKLDISSRTQLADALDTGAPR
jgi:DNA-binding CsgD family transcriptional regulator